MTLLADHNMEGHAVLIVGVLAREGWLSLLAIRLFTFADINLPHDSSDRQVWRVAQSQRLILLTGNRGMKGQDSLEQTIREENTPTCLPVITVGSVDRLDERNYREQCASRLVEFLTDVDRYMGAGRLSIT